jgi:murein L,D-transpeptidase YcbB/YkuD
MPKDRLRTILVNMERYRWLPQDMGEYYVNLNIPEYLVRIVQNTKTIFTERSVVGQVDKQTPVLQEEMEYVDFNPYWNVPDSIKVEEILPYLVRQTGYGWFGFGGGRPPFLARQNLYVKYNGREVDPNAVDWQRVDIRRFHFYQPPGGPNVLGTVKFMFPNDHDVYMHDTPQKHLFEKQVRAESHGCMRIRNPLKMAEVLLSRDQGWSMQQVERAVHSGANQTVQLRSKVPVYITYFTAAVVEDGNVRYLGDVYGHDNRMAAAMRF